jgi:hypothetical protein
MGRGLTIVAAVSAVSAVSLAGCGGGGQQRTYTGFRGNDRDGRSAHHGHRGGEQGSKPHGHRLGAGASPAARAAAHSSFIRDADGICRRADARLGRIGGRLKALVDEQHAGKVDLAGYYSRSAALTQSSYEVAQATVDELGALSRPADHGIDAYLALRATQSQLLADQAEALRRSDAGATLKLNVRRARVLSRSHKLARRIGFHVCGRGP